MVYVRCVTCLSTDKLIAVCHSTVAYSLMLNEELSFSFVSSVSNSYLPYRFMHIETPRTLIVPKSDQKKQKQKQAFFQISNLQQD